MMWVLLSLSAGQVVFTHFSTAADIVQLWHVLVAVEGGSSHCWASRPASVANCLLVLATASSGSK